MVERLTLPVSKIYLSMLSSKICKLISFPRLELCKSSRNLESSFPRLYSSFALSLSTSFFLSLLFFFLSFYLFSCVLLLLPFTISFFVYLRIAKRYFFICKKKSLVCPNIVTLMYFFVLFYLLT